MSLRSRIWLCLVLILSGSRLLSQQLAITEILARNESGIVDEDGETSDWIEIQNLDATPVNLAGWHLTDDPFALAKWRFPAVPMDSGAILVVFASGKDRAESGHELHTSFKFSGDGGYVALVRPDGITVQSELAPYPPTRDDISYGRTQTVATDELVTGASNARFLVPVNGGLGLDWTQPTFDDTAWTASKSSLGYDTEDAGGGPPGRELVNLALGGVATESTVGYGGLPERAIDGNTDGTFGNGSVTHTDDGDPAPTWQVDLGVTATLERIVLWNRLDCCPGRLSNFRVSVFVDAEEEAFVQDFFTDGVGFPAPGSGFEIPLPASTAGRNVRVEILGPNASGEAYLSLAEVQVFGVAPSGQGSVNVARGKTAMQSTTAFAGFASRAVDGNRDGDFNSSSVTHTQPSDAGPFWKVDLGSEVALDHAVLWNRTDCCSQRLSNFRVEVLDETLATVDQSDHFTNQGFPPTQDYAVAFPPGTRGRHVRISKLGPDSGGENVLSLAEVEVFSAAPGYGPVILTDVEAAMRSRNSTLYVRIPFDVVDPRAFDFLKISMLYDDGFVAYLNGIEVARRNAPASPDWSSAAAADRPASDALRKEEIDLSSSLALLRPGRNVLALHGLNISATDVDFLLATGLTASSATTGEPRHFASPSPGARNPNEGLFGFVTDTHFSVHRGFFSSPLEVAITTETPGASIRYTLDGKAPTESSGLPYLNPVHVTTTTTLRAAAFKPGFGSTNVDAQTYIFPADVILQKGTGFPTSWGGTPADYEMDPNVVGNAKYKDTIADDIVQRIPTMSIVMDTADLFGPRGIYSNTEGRGDAWERPCSMELIYPDGSEGVHVNCGVRIYGYGWRPHSATLKHAFRLMFKRKYGPPRFEYRFFPDFPVERFDSLILRSQGSRGWNDFRTSIEQTCYIRDAWARYTEQAMGKSTTSSTYVHLYLNGLYWGLYNPVERPDAEFMSEHHGGAEAEYDSINARVGNLEVIDGSLTRWKSLMTLARSNSVTTLDGYRQILQSLDMADLADYILLNFYTGNQDWVGSNGNNMRVAGAPGIGVGFKAFCWDMEYSIWNANDNVMSVLTQYDTPAALYARLRLNSEFRLAFADRAQKHLFHGGALTPEATSRRWLDRAAEIDRAVVGESARWGDRRREPPYTRDVEWVRERDRLIKSFFPQRTGVILAQLKQAMLYPTLAPPEFNQQGGTFSPGFALEMSAPAGSIYFTLDGTDPRVEGGELAAGASAYTAAIPLARSVVVKARTKDGATWSALNEAVFLLDIPPPLRITEIHYHPAPALQGSTFSADNFEFLELMNIGSEPLSLEGFRVTGGVQFEFSTGSVALLAPGETLLLVENLDAFAERYSTAGLLIAGRYSGRLSNGGDQLRLEGSFGETILDFSFLDTWYPETDGDGPSLEIVDPGAAVASWGEASAWHSSEVPGGTPGIPPGGGTPGSLQRPGDANQDSKVDIADAISVLIRLFIGADGPLPCGDGTLESAGNILLLDSNGDLKVNLTDAVYVLNYLFLGGNAPVLGQRCVRMTGCPAACTQ